MKYVLLKSLLALALCLGAVAQPGGRAALASETHSSTRDKYAFHLSAMVTNAELDKPALTLDRPLVLFVWAPDCPACLRHLPYAQALFKNLDLEKVNFMSLAISDSQDDVKEVMDDKGLDFPVLWSGSGTIGDGFEYDGWPTTYIFKQGGKLQEMVESTGSAYMKDVEDAVAAALKP